MAIVLSQAQATELRNKYQSAVARANKFRKERISGNATEIVVATVEIGAAAALAGYVRGRMEAKIGKDKYAVFGIEPEVVAGAAMIGAAYFKTFGKYDDDAARVGAALISTAAFAKGAELGKQHAGTKVSGILSGY